MSTNPVINELLNKVNDMLSQTTTTNENTTTNEKDAIKLLLEDYKERIESKISQENQPKGSVIVDATRSVGSNFGLPGKAVVEVAESLEQINNFRKKSLEYAVLSFLAVDMREQIKLLNDIIYIPSGNKQLIIDNIIKLDTIFLQQDLNADTEKQWKERDITGVNQKTFNEFNYNQYKERYDVIFGNEVKLEDNLQNNFNDFKQDIVEGSKNFFQNIGNRLTDPKKLLNDVISNTNHVIKEKLSSITNIDPSNLVGKVFKIKYPDNFNDKEGNIGPTKWNEFIDLLITYKNDSSDNSDNKKIYQDRIKNSLKSIIAKFPQPPQSYGGKGKQVRTRNRRISRRRKCSRRIKNKCIKVGI